MTVVGNLTSGWFHGFLSGCFVVGPANWNLLGSGSLRQIPVFDYLDLAFFILVPFKVFLLTG